MLDVILAGHNTFFAGAAGSGKSFLVKQICERSQKTLYVTSTTGRAAKVLKNKAKTVHSFAGIGDCHEPKEVCCVRVLCFIWLFFVCLLQRNISLSMIMDGRTLLGYTDVRTYSNA